MLSVRKFSSIKNARAPADLAAMSIQVFHLAGEPLVHMDQLVRETAHGRDRTQVPVHGDAEFMWRELLHEGPALLLMLEPLDQSNIQIDTLAPKSLKNLGEELTGVLNQKPALPSGVPYFYDDRSNH